MRLITRADDELYGAASVLAKLGRAAKLLDRLDEARGRSPDDPEAVFGCALAKMAMLPSIQAEFEAHSRFTEAVDVLGSVLVMEPRHWLARYGRARLRALIPSSYGAFAVQVSGELTSAADDLDELLVQQAEVGWQPYFASAHALAAVVKHLAGSADDVVDDLVDDLDRLVPRDSAPIVLPALGAILCEPLVTLYAIGLEPGRHRLGELMMELYGTQAAVAQALGRSKPAGVMS